MTAMFQTHPFVLQASRFQYTDRRLFFTRARLYLDRIELLGWELGKKHMESIPLNEIKRIDWDQADSAAEFHLDQGGSIRLRLPGLDQWKQSLEQRLYWSAPGRFPLASTPTSTRPDFSLHDLVTYTTSMG